MTEEDEETPFWEYEGEGWGLLRRCLRVRNRARDEKRVYLAKRYEEGFVKTNEALTGLESGLRALHGETTPTLIPTSLEDEDEKLMKLLRQFTRGEIRAFLCGPHFVVEVCNEYGSLECDCGRYAVRRTAYLRYQNREGSCAQCRAEMRGGWSQAQTDDRRQDLADNYREYGGLYGDQYDDHEQEQILEELQKKMGEPDFVPEGPALPLQAVEGYCPRQVYGQRAAFFVPLCDKEWYCPACSQFFIKGFGCTACLKVVCQDCARLELHRCSESAHADWQNCMTPQRAKLLPKGERIRGIWQPKLRDEDRIKAAHKRAPKAFSKTKIDWLGKEDET